MITLSSGEKILIEARRHWFALFLEVFGVVLSGLAPVLLLPLISILDVSVFDAYMAEYLFFSSIWLLFSWVMFFVIWTNYHLDVLIITNFRIIDIEQKALFSHDIAEVRFDRVQDVKVEVFGIIASLLDFGDIHIQTAGAAKEFVIKKMPDPHKIKDIISSRLNIAGSKKIL